MKHIEALGIGGTERMLRFLLNRMDLETRRALMGTLPADYMRLYPSVTFETIASAVREEAAR
jgi:hypothetical protein